MLLGIETSCDETAVALIDDGGEVLVHALASQIPLHRPYGGIVPEIAARAHLESLAPMLEDVLKRAEKEATIETSPRMAVAATTGPGLVGGLQVGASMGYGLARARGWPFFAVDHLWAHALVPYRVPGLAFSLPTLSALFSGGHSMFLYARPDHRTSPWHLLGETRDDSVGEVLDKLAKALGLPYPGGPPLESEARGGNPLAFVFPKPLWNSHDCTLSFSGFKTAALRLLEKHPRTPTFLRDFAASLHRTLGSLLVHKVSLALEEIQKRDLPPPAALTLVGGVASNGILRATLAKYAETRGLMLLVPPKEFCTDNAVMVAWAGAWKKKRCPAGDAYAVYPRHRLVP